MSNKRSLDTGTATTPTSRTVTKAAGMPATSAAVDAGVATTTAARPDVFNPPTGSNPPSATPNLGDQ